MAQSVVDSGVAALGAARGTRRAAGARLRRRARGGRGAHRAGRARLRRARRGRGAGSPAPSPPTPSPTWSARTAGREATWGVERGLGRRRSRRSLTAYRDPEFLASLADHRGTAPPRRRLRAGARDLPPLRRGAGPAPRRAHPPGQHRHPRGDHRRPGRDGRRSGMSVPEEYGGFATGGEARLHGHGRRHRGAVVGLARRGRLAHHPARDPHPGPRPRRHRGAEAALAAEAGHRRDHGRGGRHRARLRLRRGRHRHLGRTHRGRLADQRREDLVHLRRPGRRPHAARPHRPGPLEGAPRPLAVRRREAARRRPRLRLHPGAEPTAARPTRPGGWRAGPSTPSATAGCTPTRWPSRTGSCPTPTWSAGPRASGKGFYLQMQGFENGRLQTAARAIGVMQAAYEAALDYAPQPGGLRRAHRRVPAHPGQAGPDGRAHPGHRGSSPTRWPA